MILFVDEFDEFSKRFYSNAILIRSIMLRPVYNDRAEKEVPKELLVEIVPFDYTLYEGWWLGKYQLDGSMGTYLKCVDAYNSAMGILKTTGHIRTGDFECGSWEVVKSIHTSSADIDFY